MPWCPTCGVEYREGFRTCTDCEVDLVADPPESSTPFQPGPEWDVVAVYSTSEEAELAQGYLVEAGLDAQIVDRAMHTQPYGMNLLGEVLLYVPPDEVKRARALLDEAGHGAATLPEDAAVDVPEDGGGQA